MSYNDYPGLKGLKASGAYGTMPEDTYLRKIATTDMFEDPNQYENYARSCLKDRRPDKPFLASDESRSTEAGYGNHSSEFLNLRYTGARHDHGDPYLPDGTFLDWEFAAKDCRNTAGDPNMSAHRKQQMARSAFIKRYNDEDYSVPSNGIAPRDMVKNIKAGMNIFRNQYQNFEESLGNFHNGGVGKTGRKKDSDMVHVTTDGTVLDITELTQANRADGLTRLSNDPSIAYRHSTPDHRFKTAKYSMVRENQDLSKQDWSNTRRSARLDHANFAIIDGTMVNKELAALIMDIQGIREAQHMASTGAEYGKSEQSVNKQMKSRADELAKLLRAAQTSQTQSAHQQLGGELLNKKSRNPADTNVRNLANQPEFNHEIARCMEQSTKKQRERDRKDLREQIQQTGESFGVYHEDAPRNFNRCHLTANQTRHDEADHYIEDQKTIVNYITMVPFTNQKRMQNTSWEDYAGESDLNLDRSSRLKGHALITADDSVEGQDRSQLDLDPGTFMPEFKTDADTVRSFGRQQQLMDQGDTERGLDW